MCLHDYHYIGLQVHVHLAAKQRYFFSCPQCAAAPLQLMLLPGHTQPRQKQQKQQQDSVQKRIAEAALY